MKHENSSRIIAVADWEKCDEELCRIENENRNSLSGLLFRGHANSEWPLTTTLERRCDKEFLVEEYYNLILQMQPEVEAFTGITWDLPKWSEPHDRFAQWFSTFSGYGYMTHFRHYGFPSPLLDWTRSPYIAAYFAFAKANMEQAKNVAIFVYSETPNNQKFGPGNGPMICSHGGRALKTHRRHFQQRSAYTVCVEKSGNDWEFVPHQKIFDAGNQDQDRLYQITIPATEREKVLRLFDRFNLNEFSLFNSEESLLETLAFREIDLK